jgi:hypothetical protein
MLMESIVCVSFKRGDVGNWRSTSFASAHSLTSAINHETTENQPRQSIHIIFADLFQWWWHNATEGLSLVDYKFGGALGTYFIDRPSSDVSARTVSH